MNKKILYAVSIALLLLSSVAVFAPKGGATEINPATLPKENISGLINEGLDLTLENGEHQLELLKDGGEPVETKVLHFSTINHYVGVLASFEKIKIFADSGNVTMRPRFSIAVDLRQDTGYHEIQKFDYKLVEDTTGRFYEIVIPGNYLSHAFKINFANTISINKVEVFGQVYRQNVFRDANFQINSQIVDVYPMLDQTIKTAVELPTETTLEITAPIGQAYELTQLAIASNFSNGQGIKTIQLSYKDLRTKEWISLEKMNANYAPEQAQRRQSFMIQLPNIFTNKIKASISFNGTWNKGTITEFNAIGLQKTNSVSVADSIDHVDQIFTDSESLQLNWLKNEGIPLENYHFHLKSSSKENVISLDQKIHHSTNEEQVKLIYEVSASDGQKSETNEITVTVPAKDDRKVYAKLMSDRRSFLRNPATGWVAYVEGFESSVYNLYGTTVHNPNARNKGLSLQIDTASDAQEYWRQMDQLVDAGMPLNILYIRQPWSWFEPTEGHYAWDNPDSALSGLIEGARRRNIQLAFRVLTNSASGGRQATPQFVFDSGARWTNVDAGAYIGRTNEPYLDDPIFIEKFERFIQAFANQFDNEDTAFIDGHGHGEWGEMNNQMYTSTFADMNKVVARLQSIYENSFHHVLLGGQLMSLKGQRTIQKSFDIDGANFVMRRDAFGSDLYLNPHKQVIRDLRSKGIPLFAENCYHHFQSRDFRWSTAIDLPTGGGPREYGGDDPFYTMHAMMKKVVDDAVDLRANTLDLRTLEDCKLFTYYGKDLLDKFTSEGGYRISLHELSYALHSENERNIAIDSEWENLGEGIVPNKNKRWGNKIKIAFALLNQDGSVAYKDILSTDELNVGDFERDQIIKHSHTMKLGLDIENGQYKLAVALVNEKKNFQPYIRLANFNEQTTDEWFILGDVQLP